MSGNIIQIYCYYCGLGLKWCYSLLLDRINVILRKEWAQAVVAYCRTNARGALVLYIYDVMVETVVFCIQTVVHRHALFTDHSQHGHAAHMAPSYLRGLSSSRRGQ